MLLSIGLMVKNEEQYLERCLQGLVPILESIESELIIVDTGSTDGTQDIARQFTEQVYEYEWTNDFAQMRNIVLSHTSGEWFFFVDGDEIVTDASGIIEFFTTQQHHKYNAGSILMKNFLSTDNEDSYGIFQALRLFRNDQDFHFKGVVHEQPMVKGPITEIKGEIIHYGYLNDDPELMEYKFQRNVELLEKALKKDPQNVYTLFQLSQSYAMYKDYKGALEYILTAYEYAQKGDLSQYSYVLNQLANLYNRNKLYVEAQYICEKGLKLKKDNIDLYYFLAFAQIELGEFDKAVQSFERYLGLVDKFEHGELVFDLSIDFKTVGDKETAYGALCGLYNKQGKPEEALIVGGKIEKKDVFKKAIPHLVDAHIKLNKLSEIKALYEAWKYDENMLSLLEQIMEEQRFSMEMKEKRKLSTIFADVETPYGLLNYVRADFYDGQCGIEPHLWEKLKLIELDNTPIYYADILFTLIRYEQPIFSYVKSVRNDRLSGYIAYLNNEHKEFADRLITYMQTDKLWSTGQMTSEEEKRVKTGLSYGLLQNDALCDQKYMEVFKLYVECGINFLESSYNSEILDKALVSWIRTGADGFLLYMRLACNADKASVDYVRFLRLGLGEDASMKRGIDLLLAEVQEGLVTSELDELDKLKKSVQETIKEAINAGELETAVALINEYEDTVGVDAPLYSAKGIIYMIDGQLEEAEKVFLAGLELEPNNSDLLYNLGYLSEAIHDLAKANLYFQQALLATSDFSLKQEIEGRLLALTESSALLTLNKNTHPDHKIAFLVETPLHYYVYKSVMEELTSRSLSYDIIVNDVTMRFDPNVEYMFHRTMAFINGQKGINGNISLLSEELSKVGETYRYDALFSTGFIGDFMLPLAKHHFRMIYSLAKEVYVYSWWNVHYDLVFCYGQHDYQRLNILNSARMVGNPKLDEFFSTREMIEESALDILKIDSTKRTILYAPTYGSLSSIDRWHEEISRLQKDYNVIVKMHHRTAYAEKLRREIIKSKFSIVIDDTCDPSILWSVCDILISDNSGIVYEGIQVDADIILLDTYVGKEHSILTDAGSIDQRIKFEICSLNSPSDLSHILKDTSVWSNQRSKRERIRKDLFEYNDGLSGKRVVEQMLEFLDGSKIDHANYFLQNLRQHIFDSDGA